MKFSRSGIVTLIGMLIVMGAGLAYILFLVDESDVQKRDNTPAAQALLIEDEAKQFTNLQGESVSLAEDFGNVIVVSAWASWCPQCGAGLKELGEIADAYKDREVVVIAMNRAENRFTAERYLSTITYSPNLRIVLDPSDHYFGKSAGYAMPETIIYTKNGAEALHQRGDLNASELRTTLDSLLQ